MHSSSQDCILWAGRSLRVIGKCEGQNVKSIHWSHLNVWHGFGLLKVGLLRECASRPLDDNVSSIISSTDAFFNGLVLHELRQKASHKRVTWWQYESRGITEHWKRAFDTLRIWASGTSNWKAHTSTEQSNKWHRDTDSRPYSPALLTFPKSGEKEAVFEDGKSVEKKICYLLHLCQQGLPSWQG